MSTGRGSIPGFVWDERLQRYFPFSETREALETKQQRTDFISRKNRQRVVKDLEGKRKHNLLDLALKREMFGGFTDELRIGKMGSIGLSRKVHLSCFEKVYSTAVMDKYLLLSGGSEVRCMDISDGISEIQRLHNDVRNPEGVISGTIHILDACKDRTGIRIFQSTDGVQRSIAFDRYNIDSDGLYIEKTQIQPLGDSSVFCAVLLPRGSVFVGRGRMALNFSRESFKICNRFEFNSDVLESTAGDDLNIVFVGLRDGTIHLVDLRSKSKDSLTRFKMPSSVNNLQLYGHATNLQSSSVDGTVRLFDLRTGRIFDTIVEGDSYSFASFPIALDPSNNLLAIRKTHTFLSPL